MVNFSDPHAFRRTEGSSDWYFPPQVDSLPERPLQPSASTLFPFQGVDTPEQRERTANYYNAVARLDVGVGMLLDELRKAGHEDNTVVVFCGDHGPPFARGKTTCYEPGLRVPFIVRWPGVSRPHVSSAMVSTTDIAPTLFDAAVVNSPAAMHGRSLRSVLGGSAAGWRRYLAGEFHLHGARPFYPRRAIRDDRYHLILNLLAGKAKPSTGIDGDRAYPMSANHAGEAARRAFAVFADPPEYELYDLREDPVEFRNLAGDPKLAGVRNRLAGALLAWRKETSDPFLDPAFVEKMRSASI